MGETGSAYKVLGRMGNSGSIQIGPNERLNETKSSSVTTLSTTKTATATESSTDTKNQT